MKRAVFFFLLFALGSHAFAVVNYDGLNSKEERDVQADLDQEFREIGARAYILRDTVLYLYKPHKSRYYNINSYSFRGAEVKPGDGSEYNIMVVGGSAVHGYYQSDEQTIPWYLEQRLREKYPKCAINVYNLGIEGYLFQREIALARKMKSLLRPDLVIFYEGFNDLCTAYYYGYPELKPFGADAANFFARTQKENYLGALVGLANWFREKVEWPITDRKLDKNRAAFVKGYLSDAARIRDEFKKERVPVLFVIQPTIFTKSFRTIRENKLLEHYVRLNNVDRLPDFYVRCLEDLYKTAKAKGVILHDIDDIFDAVDAYDGVFFRDWVHCNIEGNQIVADRLAQLVERNIALCVGRR